MKKKNKDVPLPLKMVQLFSKHDEDVWDLISENGEISYERAAAINDTLKINSTPLLLYGLGLWRKHKQIFEFDECLCDDFMGNDLLESDIPVDSLENMPFDCFYVSLPKNYIVVKQLQANTNGCGRVTKHDLDLDGILCYKKNNELVFNLFFTECSVLNLAILMKRGYTVREACAGG